MFARESALRVACLLNSRNIQAGIDDFSSGGAGLAIERRRVDECDSRLPLGGSRAGRFFPFQKRLPFAPVRIH